jgi:hypothetical protein
MDPEGHPLARFLSGFVDDRTHKAAGDALSSPSRNDRESDEMPETRNHVAGPIVRTAQDAEHHPDYVIAVKRQVQLSARVRRPSPKAFRVLLQPATGIRRPPDANRRLNLVRLRVPHDDHDGARLPRLTNAALKT